MADYIYLLENRLSQAQQQALLAVREIAKSKGLTIFLVGGAVRDLTSGSPVRDLDVVVQGNALKLSKSIEKAGGAITGEYELGQELFVRFPGNVRMEVGSALSVAYPKPGKPVVKPATILEDLRRRDFTANAMALSLNEGSYGLLMDPLNGVADIENRELRLVSNYGFIESPVRMIRAQRFAARLGWQLEEKTQVRYETGKTEGYIEALSAFYRGYEAEEIVHEEDPLRVMRRLEGEGWMKVLSPAWTTAKANVAEWEKLREAEAQLLMQGIHPDASAAQFPLLTAKLSATETAELKRSFPRPGFVAEIDALEGQAKQFAAELGAKAAAAPSASWKLIAAAPPEVVLWVAYSTKNASLQAKFKSFYTEWPQARHKIPYTLMQEMRIVPDLPGYSDLVEALFFELMDGKLGTVEEMKAYLEPHSPPAPPPPVHLRRPRASKKDAKAKSRKKAEVEADVEIDGADDLAVELDDIGVELPVEIGELDVDEPAGEDGGEELEPKVVKQPAAVNPAVAVKAVVPSKAVALAKTAAAAKGAAPVKAAAAKPVPAKVAAKVAAKPVVRKATPAKAAKAPAGKAVATKVAAKKAVPAAGKKAPAKVFPAKEIVAKVAAKKAAPAKKILAKVPVKKAVARKIVAAKKKPVKVAGKKKR